MTRFPLLLVACLLALPPLIAPAAEREARITPEQALNAKISQVRFERATLREAFDWVRDTLETNLYVDWGAMQELGVDPEKPLNVNLKWVSVPRLLRLMLQETGRGDQLTYYVSGNVLTVTTKAKADEQLFTRVYSIEDLIIRPGKIRRSTDVDLGGDVNTTAGRGSGGGTSGGGSSGEGIFGRDRSDDTDDDEDSDKARGAEIVDLIRKATPAEAWEDAGGRSTITYFRGKLILTAPRSIHALVGGQIRD